MSVTPKFKHINNPFKCPAFSSILYHWKRNSLVILFHWHIHVSHKISRFQSTSFAIAILAFSDRCWSGCVNCQVPGDVVCRLHACLKYWRPISISSSTDENCWMTMLLCRPSAFHRMHSCYWRWVGVLHVHYCCNAWLLAVSALTLLCGHQEEHPACKAQCSGDT